MGYPTLPFFTPNRRTGFSSTTACPNRRADDVNAQHEMAGLTAKVAVADDRPKDELRVTFHETSRERLARPPKSPLGLGDSNEKTPLLEADLAQNKIPKEYRCLLTVVLFMPLLGLLFFAVHPLAVTPKTEIALKPHFTKTTLEVDPFFTGQARAEELVDNRLTSARPHHSLARPLSHPHARTHTTRAMQSHARTARARARGWQQRRPLRRLLPARLRQVPSEGAPDRPRRVVLQVRARARARQAARPMASGAAASTGSRSAWRTRCAST